MKLMTNDVDLQASTSYSTFRLAEIWIKLEKGVPEDQDSLFSVLSDKTHTVWILQCCVSICFQLHQINFFTALACDLTFSFRSFIVLFCLFESIQSVRKLIFCCRWNNWQRLFWRKYGLLALIIHINHLYYVLVAFVLVSALQPCDCRSKAKLIEI